jgi:NADH:ubiquinone oxidoreductase subunit 2 (subunit N)
MKVNDHPCDSEISTGIPKIKRLFAYSSISNTGWIALGATLSLASTVIFMVTYFIVSIVTILLLNLVGLPRVFSSAAQQDWAV